MNTKIIATAIGALMLGGTTLVNAGPLDDLFRLLPHPGLHLGHGSHHYTPHREWHQDNRGFARYDADRREHGRIQPRVEHRFEARRGYDRRDHRGFGSHGHQR